MMNLDTELKLLEEEFPKSSRIWATHTDAALDQRILSIADRTADYLAQQHMRKERERLSIEKGKGLTRPTRRSAQTDTPERFLQSDKAMDSSMLQDLMTNASMRPADREPANVPPGAEKMLASLKGAKQHVWLDCVADIVKAGDIELAIYLLRLYRTIFKGK